MIKELRLKHAVPFLCRTLKVSRSGYYAWLGRKPSKRTQEDARAAVEILAAHKRTRESCGPERLQKDMAEHGTHLGIYRIRKIRKQLGIKCKQVKKFKATTDSRHRFPVAENLLEQKFEVMAPGLVWVSDITYIGTEEGWLYLAGHKDLCTGEIVGYAMGARMTRELITRSLLGAVRAKRPAKGLIHHSDRGSQYCSPKYRELLDKLGITASMSRKGNCYDNAPMESFWGTLKTELVYHRRYKSREEAIREITEYIEIFYNRQRRQARLAYLSPAVFEKRFYVKQRAA